ncbi:MAG: hypothetical protein LBS51_02795 [Oscillospiraceae bacterium]|nr:hypothetical protein [Oscillospiraceae bacterium]
MAEEVRQTAGSQAAPAGAPAAPRNAPPPGAPPAPGDAQRKTPGGKRAARTPRRGKDKKAAGARQGRKRGKRKLIIIIAAAVLLAAALAAFVFVVIEFDQWGFRTAIIELVDSLDPEYVDLTRREAALAAGVAELETQRQDAVAEDERLEALRLELERREALLEAREEQTEQNSVGAPGYWLGLSPQEIEDMESLGKTYAAMESAAAAEIMAELYTVNDAAAILYYMAEKNAAPILEAMDRQFAAAVTEALLIK